MDEYEKGDCDHGLLFLELLSQLIIVTVCRYYAVCLPLRAGLIWTKNKAGLVCLVSWLLSILLTSPILAIANYKDDPTNPRCTTDVDPPWTKAFFLSIISLFFWLPLCVLVLLYAIISSHLTANVNVTKHTGNEGHWLSTTRKRENYSS